MRISVIILTADRPALLRDCLAALRGQTRPADEIIVVNNGSQDASITDVENVRVIPGPEKGAYGASRNKGVAEASGDWVAFTDDDCLPAPDWLERIERVAEGAVDTVGGLVEPADELPWPRWWHPEMGWAIGVGVPGHLGPDAGSVYYGQTANWASRRAVLLLEPFQELSASFEKGVRVYEAGREDAELWRRLRRNGWRVRFDPRLRVRHRISAERLRLAVILRRAWLDGAALQRREPARERLYGAVHFFLGLPADFSRFVWHGHGQWLRDAAWRLVWASREMGQCVQYCRREGWPRGIAFLTGAACSTAVGMMGGFAKRILRRLGVAIMRAVRPPRKPPERPARVLVAALGWLGDMVLLHPFLESLKAVLPDAQVVLLTNRLGEELYREEPFLDRMVRVGQAGDPAWSASLVRGLFNSEGPDLILVPYFYGQHPASLFACRGAVVVTFWEEVGFPRRFWHDRADVRVPKPRGRSETRNLLALFRRAGLERLLPGENFVFTPAEEERHRVKLSELGLVAGRYLAFAPGSGKDFKLWPEERWAELLRRVLAKNRGPVALLGSPSEEALRRRVAGDLEAAGARIDRDPSVREMALMLRDARLLVCPDNGPRHLAVAMGTPTLALFGSTDERQWGAARQSGRHRNLRRCVFDLTPEERIGLSPTHQMERIKVDDVEAELEEMLSITDDYS
jgi:ADP-heptose:LPS heptosyltransferase